MSQGVPNTTRRSKAEVEALLGQLHGDMPKAALVKVFGSKILGHTHFDDMMQEVWLGLVKSAHAYDERHGKSFPQWAYGNAINYAKNTLRLTRISGPQNRSGEWMVAVPLCEYDREEMGERAKPLTEEMKVQPEAHAALEQRDARRLWAELRRHLSYKGKVSARMGGEWYLQREYGEVSGSDLASASGCTRQNVDRRVHYLAPEVERWSREKRNEPERNAA